MRQIDRNKVKKQMKALEGHSHGATLSLGSAPRQSGTTYARAASVSPASPPSPPRAPITFPGGPQEPREERAREALTAGKNVLCERPIAFSLQVYMCLYVCVSCMYLDVQASAHHFCVCLPACL